MASSLSSPSSTAYHHGPPLLTLESLKKEVSFLGYYPGYRLLLCSRCSKAINASAHAMVEHVKKHLREDEELAGGEDSNPKVPLSQERKKEIFSYISSLDIALAIKESYGLILQDSTIKTIQGFPELKIIRDIYQCSIPDCLVSRLNKVNIRRHLSKDHLISKSLISYYKVIKQGQCLDYGRFYFGITEDDLDRSLTLTKRVGDKRQASSTRLDLNLEYYKDSGLENYLEKEEDIKVKSTIFNLDTTLEKLSPFLDKTRYPVYLKGRDLKVLAELTRPIVREREAVLYTISLGLKDLFYSAVEKSLSLNRNHLFLLSTFNTGLLSRKGFRNHLTMSTYKKYLEFFTVFIAFIFRSFASQDPRTSLLSLSKEESTLVQEIIDISSEIGHLEDSENDLLSSSLISKELTSGLGRLRYKDLFRNDYRGDRDKGGVDKEEGDEDNEDEDEVEGEDEEGEGEDIIDHEEDDNNDLSLSLDSHKEVSFMVNTIIKLSSIDRKGSPLRVLLKERLTRLLILFLKEEIDLDIFSSNINIFFSVIAIHPSFLTLRDSKELAIYYSRFIYAYQLVVIDHSFREYLEARGERPKGEDNKGIKVDPSLTIIIKSFMNKYFMNSSSTCFSEILNNRSLAFFINKTLSSSSRVSLSLTQRDTLIYGHLSISVDNFKSLFRESILDSYKVLTEDLLFDLPDSKFSSFNIKDFSIYEDLDNRDINKCYRDFHPNSSYFNSFLYKEVFDKKSLRDRFFWVDQHGVLRVKRPEALRYFEKIREFLKIFSLSMHLTSGLPPRGTEWSILRYLNSDKAIREVFIDRSSLLFIIKLAYTKTQSVKDQASQSLRFLGPALSRVFFLYTLLVCPFVRFLEVSLDSDAPCHPFLFQVNNKILSSSNISLRLNNLSKVVIGQRISLREHRQLIVAMVSFFFPRGLTRDLTRDPGSLGILSHDVSKDDDDYRQVISSQMNHSYTTKELNYGRASTTLKNVRGDFQSRNLEFCLGFFGFFDILELDVSSSRRAATSAAGEAAKEGLPPDKPLDLAALLYQEEHGKKQRRDEEGNKDALVYRKKHSRAEPSVGSSALSLEGNLGLKKVKINELYSYDSVSTLDSNLEALLREFLRDPKAIFRSREQLNLIKAILSNIPYIIGILPTNGGKSLVYLLLSSLSSSRINIVLIPLVGLKGDIERRALELGIPVAIYEDTREFKTLTLVSIESIASKAFLGSLRELSDSGSIDRVFMDECHILITHANFRSIMFRVKQVLDRSRQFVFLTGSLPGHLEDALKQELLLDRPLVIRGETSRGDISYKRAFYPTAKAEDRLKDLKYFVDIYRASFKSFREKMLIYCPSVREVKEVSTLLDCAFYHSNQEDQSTILPRFREVFDAYNQVLVTSTSLVEGFDYPHIRVVIIKDFAYSLIDYVQASGRAGRDGLPAISMLLTSREEGRDRPGDSLERSKFRALVREEACLRRVIDNYLDSSLVDECPPGKEKCSLCWKRHDERAAVARNIVSFNGKVEDGRIAFVQQLRLSSLGCLYHALLKAGEPVKAHLGSACDRYAPVEELAEEVQRRLRAKEVALVADSCCFTCLLPTLVCSNLRGQENVVEGCFDALLLCRFIATMFAYHATFRDELAGEALQAFQLADSSLAARRPSDRANLPRLLRLMTRKTRSQELDTEEIVASRVLRDFLTRRGI